MRRPSVSAALCIAAIPFAYAVGATFGEAYRCPRGEDCVASVGAFITAGLGALVIATALVTSAVAINVRPTGRRRLVVLAVAATCVIAAILFSFVWFTPHPRE